MSDVEPSQGSSETQFVEQSGDDENLWEVLEITAEKGKLYKVRWAGTDPETGQPWKQSWVPKHDCTPALVGAWKAKQVNRRKSNAASSRTRSTARPASVASSSKKSVTPTNAPPPPSPSPRKRPRESVIATVELPVGPPSKKRRTATFEFSSPPRSATPTGIVRKQTQQLDEAPRHKPRATNTSSVPPSRSHNGHVADKSRPIKVEQTVEHLEIPPPSPVRPRSSKSAVTQPEASSSKLPIPIRSPILSPNAKARLELWEREVGYNQEATPIPTPNHAKDRAPSLPVPSNSSPPSSPIQHPTVMDIPSTPRENMVSRMRPKTPVSRSVSHLSLSPTKPSSPQRTIKKVLQPVPVVTPSVFAPHLPSSSLNGANDTIESVEVDPPEEDSIDQFSSPIKAPTKSTRPSLIPINGRAKRTQQAQNGELRSTSVRSRKPRSVSSDDEDELEGTQPPLGDDDDDYVPPPSPPPQPDSPDPVALREEEEESSQEIEDELKRRESSGQGELSLPTTQSSPTPATRRPRQRLPKSSSPELTPPQPTPPTPPPAPSVPTVEPLFLESDVADETRVPPSTQPDTQDSFSTRNSSQRSQSYPPTQIRHLGAAMNLLNVKSEEISKIEAELTVERARRLALEKDIKEAEEAVAKAKATSAADLDHLRLAHAAEKASWLSKQEVAEASRRDLEESLKKSDLKWKLDEAEWQRERSTLTKSLSAAKRTLEAETEKCEEQRQAHAAEKAQWEQERLSLQQSVESTSSMQTEWADERSNWQTEREKFAAEIEALKAALKTSESDKVSAEKDRELFREEYARASAYVSDIRDENKELSKRVGIAESQTTAGVEAIKLLYEAKVQAAEQEATRNRHLVKILTERDLRTGGEDIRRRANLEPELRKRVDELDRILAQSGQLISSLRVQVSNLEQEREHLINHSNVFKKVVSIQAEELAKKNKFAASQLSSQLQSQAIEPTVEPSQISKAGDGLQYLDDDDSDVLVFRCLWRPETDVPPFSCPHAFFNIQDLEEHLVTAHAEAVDGQDNDDEEDDDDDLEYI